MAKRKRINIQRFAAANLAADNKAREEAKAIATKDVDTNDSFVNYEQNIGIGADNSMSSGTYGFNPITRQRALLEWIYRGSWLGGVAVDVKADDMTKGGVDIIGELDPTDVQIIEAEAVKLAIWEKLNESLKWAGLYGGAIAVLLIDGQDNETPLRLNTIKKGQFCGLLPLDRWMVEPTLYDLVTDYGPNLGLPKYYRITSMAPALCNQKIHYSRVIRFEGIKLPYYQRVMENLWGLSVLERMYDRMIAFDSATTGAAQLVYKSYIRNYKIKNLRQIVAAGGDALIGLTKYVDMMRRFQGIEGMTLLDSEDEFNADSHGSFGGLSDILTRFMEQCSGSLQIPLVRLFGQSPSGFSTGETDLRNYYDTVNKAQEQDLKVDVTKVYRAMMASLDIKIPDGFGLSFRSLWQLTDIEKSDIANKNLDTVSRAEEQGIIDRATSLKELKQQSKLTGMFTNITEEQIEEAENEPPPIPEDVEIELIKAGSEEDESQNGVDIDNNNLTNNRPDQPRAELQKTIGEAPKARDNSEQPSAAGIMFVTRKGKILLLKRAKYAPEGLKWGLPGGHVEEDELFEDTARREALEETGIDYKGNLFKIDDDGGFVTFIALIDSELPVKINDESIAYRWKQPALFVEGQFHSNLERVLRKIGQ